MGLSKFFNPGIKNVTDAVIIAVIAHFCKKLKKVFDAVVVLWLFKDFL